MGFSKQEYRSGVPLPSPLDYTVHGILQARILECVAFPFSRGIFPTQGSDPGLLHCRRILYQLSHQGSLWLQRGIKYSYVLLGGDIWEDKVFYRSH